MYRKIKEHIYKHTKFGKTRYLNFLYKYDMDKYYEYSCMNDKNLDCLATKIRILVHSIEKSVTLPNFELGHGKDKIIELIDLYNQYIDYEDKKDSQVLQLVKDTIVFYMSIQGDYFSNFDFIPKEFKNNLSDNKSLCAGVQICKPLENNNFATIAQNRHSARKFSNKDIPKDVITNVIKLAQTAPSACNRQPIKVYACINDKKIQEIMKIHGGLRGFSQPKVVFAITGDLNLYLNEYERNTIFVDGGIFIMNLLYSLDYFSLASCPIIWGSEPDMDKKLTDILKISNHEKVVGLVVSGYYADDDFIAAISHKRDVEDVLTII